MLSLFLYSTGLPLACHKDLQHSIHQLLWNLVKTFDTSDISLQKLHALLVLYLPALVLHDTHRNIGDTTEGPSPRSVIGLRLRQAEAGLWLPLVDDQKPQETYMEN